MTRSVLALILGISVFLGPTAGGAAKAAASPAKAASSPTSIIVGYASGNETRAVNSALSLNAKNPRRAKSGRFSVLEVPKGASAEQLAKRLSAMPGVQYAEPNYTFTALEIPSDPDFSSQWGMTRIDAPSAWNTTKGAGVTVAVIDSGIDLSHPEFAGRIDTANDWDFVNNDSTALDDHGHGTHVAGIVGAAMNNATGVHGVTGVASECTILPIKVIGPSGTCTAAEVAEGIDWAASHGAEVINLSLGSTSYSTAIDQAVQAALSQNIVIVAASGNDAEYGILYPARLDAVIGVGSITRFDLLSDFSNYGPGVDICAPGSDILSTWTSSGYAVGGGTSMAAPHVAGVVALIRAEHPEWNRAQVEAQLLGTTYDLGAAGRDDYFGYGVVQAGRAVGTTVPAPGVLSGTVTDAEGVGIAGVSVAVEGYGNVSSAADGRYAVADIAPGSHSVTFSKNGYASQTRTVTIRAGETTTLDAVLLGAEYQTVYRFYNRLNGSHFYTASTEERDLVLARWPDVYTLDGAAYTINTSNPANSSPLYRFYNRRNGSHFYTASETERNMVIARWSDTFTYDGPAYNVCATAVAGATPVYRFYNKRNGSHFYTASAEEFDIVLTRWPDVYSLDGQAFWLAP